MFVYVCLCTRTLLLCVCLRVFVYSRFFLMKSRIAYCLSRDFIKHSYKLVFLFCIYVCLQLCSQSEQFFLKYSTFGLGFNEAK